MTSFLQQIQKRYWVQCFLKSLNLCAWIFPVIALFLISFNINRYFFVFLIPLWFILAFIKTLTLKKNSLTLISWFDQKAHSQEGWITAYEISNKAHPTLPEQYHFLQQVKKIPEAKKLIQTSFPLPRIWKGTGLLLCSLLCAFLIQSKPNPSISQPIISEVSYDIDLDSIQKTLKEARAILAKNRPEHTGYEEELQKIEDYLKALEEKTRQTKEKDFQSLIGEVETAAYRSEKLAEKIQRELDQNNSKALAQELEQQLDFKKLGEHLLQNSMSDAGRQAEKLSQQTQNQSTTEPRKRMAQSLNKALAKSSNNSKNNSLRPYLQKAAQSLQKGQSQQASQSFQRLSQHLNRMGQKQSMQNRLQSAANRLRQPYQRLGLAQSKRISNQRQNQRAHTGKSQPRLHQGKRRRNFLKSVAQAQNQRPSLAGSKIPIPGMNPSGGSQGQQPSPAQSVPIPGQSWTPSSGQQPGSQGVGVGSAPMGKRPLEPFKDRNTKSVAALETQSGEAETYDVYQEHHEETDLKLKEKALQAIEVEESAALLEKIPPSRRVYVKDYFSNLRKWVEGHE